MIPKRTGWRSGNTLGNWLDGAVADPVSARLGSRRSGGSSGLSRRRSPAGPRRSSTWSTVRGDALRDSNWEEGIEPVIRLVAVSTVGFAVALLAIGCGSSSDSGSEGARQASAVGVSGCPNQRSTQHRIDYVNTTGAPLRARTGTTLCAAFSETGNPMSINSQTIKSITPEAAGRGNVSAMQRLEVVNCAEQTKPVCRWDKKADKWVDDCVQWPLQVEKAKGADWVGLGSVTVKYCGFGSLADNTVQIMDPRSLSGKIDGKSVTVAPTARVDTGGAQRVPLVAITTR